MLKFDKSTIGADHILFTIPLNNLALTLIRLGKLEEARYYLNKANRIVESVYGPVHSSLIIQLCNLATTYALEDNFGQALKYNLQAFEVAKKTVIFAFETFNDMREKEGYAISIDISKRHRMTPRILPGECL